jgi:hypothetical protein
MDEFVAELRAKGVLSPEAARRVAELDDRSHLPLAREIHALLYLGAALILAGVGATVKDRLDQLGPMTILAAMGLAAAGCFAYCFRAAPPFAPGKAESPTAAFDYLLYLACGLVGIFFSYLEWKWKLLGSWWDLYLFGSGLLFTALAYRFDNRLVLATGLLNLASWLGLRAGIWNFLDSGSKPALIAYGAALAAVGFTAARGELKPHFEGTYRTLGVHLALATLLSDAKDFDRPQFWVLLAACAALGAWSMRERRFDTFAAAVGYAYVAALACFLQAVGRHDFDVLLWTIIISSGTVLAVLLWARARFKEAAS